MRQPQRDERGVLPHDHEGIKSDDELIRYIPAVHVNYVNGIPELSSALFSPSSPPNDPRSSVSVDAKKLLEPPHATPPFRAKPNEGYAELNVKQVRELNLQVGWDPDSQNSAHCGIWGVGSSRPMKRKLRDLAQIKLLPAL